MRQSTGAVLPPKLYFTSIILGNQDKHLAIEKYNCIEQNANTINTV